MQQKNANAFLVGGVIAGVMTMFLGIIGFVFKLIGVIYVNNPDEVEVTINGRVLQGEEAAEMALKVGNVMSTVGGVILIGTAVLFVICLILLIIYAGKRKQMNG